MTEILTSLCNRFDETRVLKTQVYDWCFVFYAGREWVENKLYERYPQMSRMIDNIHQVHGLIVDNRHINVRDVVNELKISIGSIGA